MTSDLLTPREVARIFRVNAKTVSRWAASGKLPYIRTVGGHHRYLRDAVERLAAIHFQGGGER